MEEVCQFVYQHLLASLQRRLHSMSINLKRLDRKQSGEEE